MSVMSLKHSTKSWSDAKNDTITKGDNLRNLSAQDQQKIGEEDVGNLLNKIADANWVDPEKKVRATGNNELGKDAFMKLMLTQMKNQDPMNPMQSHEMAAQLAQFTSLEQLQNVNTTLGEMHKEQAPLANFQALGFIGKAVSGDSSKFVRAEGDDLHDFKFNLPQNSSEVVIKVRDPNGEIARTFNLKDLKQGENKISWNGVRESGQKSQAGEYQFIIEAKTETGSKIAVKTEFAGTITGVNYSAEGPVLMIGNQTVKLSEVKKIIDPNIKQNDQNVKDVTSQDLQKSADQKQTGDNTIGRNEKPTSSLPPNLEANVAMARGMMNKVAKETDLK